MSNENPSNSTPLEPTQAEIEAGGKAIQERYWEGDLTITISDSYKVCTEFAKAALEAAAKVRNK